MIYAKDKEQAYRTVPEGTYYHGMTLIDGDVHEVMLWSELRHVKGTDQIVNMMFRLFDVTITGSGLLQLIRDAKRHRIDILTVTPRHQSFTGGEGVIVTKIFVKAAQS
jgi:hypothetical protein